MASDERLPITMSSNGQVALMSAERQQYVERDFRNRALGRAGEEFVIDLERRRLAAGDRGDLARKVRWVAMEDGDGAGFDVLSFDLGGKERLIEVKTTNGAAQTPFFLTRHEMVVAGERSIGGTAISVGLSLALFYLRIVGRKSANANLRVVRVCANFPY